MDREPFDLGAYVGIGLSSQQIYFLAGVLFFGIFAFSAMRRAGQAGGIWAAVWGSAAIALLAISVHVAGRGLSDQLPVWLVPFTDQQPIQRAAVIAVLCCWAFVFFSAHWVNDSLLKWLYRLAGLACTGSAIWLGISWFGEELPEEARAWTSREIFIQVGVVTGLLLLVAALWMKGRFNSPHVRWAYRTLIPIVLGGLGLLLLDRFANDIPEDWRDFPARRIVWAFTMIGTASGFILTISAWIMRERVKIDEPVKPFEIKPKPAPAKPLPVAVQIDDQGRPIVPRQ